MAVFVHCTRYGVGRFNEFVKEEDDAMIKIYVTAQDLTLSYAAEELKKYIRMMMPDASNPAVCFGDGTDGIRLGVMSYFGLDTSDAEDIALDDIMYIDCDGRSGVIAGANPRAVLLAVYEFLRHNGCRWLYPGIDGEYIPLKNIEYIKYRFKPSMRYRGVCDEGASSQSCMLEAIEFYPKLGLNLISLEFFNPIGYYSDYYNHTGNRFNRHPEPVTDMNVLQWRKMCEAEVEKRGLLLQNVGHGWTVRPFGMQEWGDSERCKLPEEFRPLMAEVGGVRGLINGMPHLTNVCMSNPEARRRIVSAAADYAKRQTNVTHLSINFADGFNHHCECEECRKRLPSDWLVILLNEIDAELTERGLDTRISCAAYEDTCWPPVTEKLNNPKRYLFSGAIIWRDFTKPIGSDIPTVEIPTYERNKNKSIKDLRLHMTCIKEWIKNTGISDTVSFDYHFWRSYYYDVGTASICRVIHNDVKDFRANGFSGMIEDASQRSYFPNGFAMYVYARTLLNTEEKYECIVEDYFYHAYGEGWRAVYSFLEKISELFSSEYVSGLLSENAEAGNRYNPSKESDFIQVQKLSAEFRAFIEKQTDISTRVGSISYRLLYLYTKYCEGLAGAFIPKCKGDDELARELFAEFLRDFGKYELEIERYYDQSLVAYSFDVYSRIFKGAVKAESSVNIF